MGKLNDIASFIKDLRELIRDLKLGKSIKGICRTMEKIIREGSYLNRCASLNIKTEIGLMEYIIIPHLFLEATYSYVIINLMWIISSLIIDNPAIPIVITLVVVACKYFYGYGRYVIMQGYISRYDSKGKSIKMSMIFFLVSDLIFWLCMSITWFIFWDAINIRMGLLSILILSFKIIIALSVLAIPLIRLSEISKKSIDNSKLIESEKKQITVEMFNDGVAVGTPYILNYYATSQHCIITVEIKNNQFIINMRTDDVWNEPDRFLLHQNGKINAKDVGFEYNNDIVTITHIKIGDTIIDVSNIKNFI